MGGRTGAAGRILRGLSGAFGLEVHRRSRRRMRLSMAETLAHISGMEFRPTTVIDVGVGYGSFDLYEAFSDSTFLLIEPLVEFRPVLDDIQRQYRAQYVLAAAGRKQGTTVIFVHPYLEGSSLLRERADTGGIVTREVPMVTVDDVCDEHGLKGPYLIKVDVQGGELEVMSGAKRKLAETEVVILEVSLFQFVERGPELHDVVAFMKDLGFVTYDIFGGHTRPLDGALGQVDMAFVKERGRFRRSHVYGQT